MPRREEVELTDERVTPLVERIKPILAGHSPELQGAVLADCLAIWLAGHVVPGDPAATREVRQQLLSAHLECVDALVPINAAMMGIADD